MYKNKNNNRNNKKNCNKLSAIALNVSQSPYLRIPSNEYEYPMKSFAKTVFNEHTIQSTGYHVVSVFRRY